MSSCEIEPLELECDGRAPLLARRFLRVVNERQPVPRLDDAELLLSELVANAQIHGAPPLKIAIEPCENDGIKVCVHDGNPSAPFERKAGVWDESGRGLQLVDVISDSWGVEPQPNDGKIVWFVVRG